MQNQEAVSNRGFKYPWQAQIGLSGSFLFLFYYMLQNLGFKVKNRYFPIWVKGLSNSFKARFGTSDGAVFNQIFVQREYSCLGDVQDPQLIIDCGANVGYSSLWFLQHYPGAHVIAIEPNDENFNLCRRNLSDYSKRVSLVHAAVWPYETRLVMEEGKEGREWAFRVRECCDGEKSNSNGVEIERLLKQSGFKNIDILKIDIEKAEKILFAQGYESWLSKVKNIVIELHDQECEEVFFKALSGYEYDLSTSGELTVCKNIMPFFHDLGAEIEEESQRRF